MSAITASRSLFRPGLVLALVLLSAFAFSAFMALAAFAPDLKDRANGGRHAWSKSAIGYAAIAQLLTADGSTVSKSRNTEVDRTPMDLTVLTPNVSARPARMDPLLRWNTLVVLPKWNAQPDMRRRDWVVGYGLVSPKVLREQAQKWLETRLPKDPDRKRKPLLVARVKSPVSERQTEIIQSRQEAMQAFRKEQKEREAKRAAKETAKAEKDKAEDKADGQNQTSSKQVPEKEANEPDPYFADDGKPRRPQTVWEMQNNAVLAPIDAWNLTGPFAGNTFRPGTIDNLQTMTWDELEPLIANGNQILLGKLKHTKKGENIYVLSDPDLLNNMGVLGSESSMQAGLMVLDTLAPKQPHGFLFDMTLHGFGKNVNLLKTVLMPPFLGVTLCALAAAMLMGWSAWRRFGPAREAKPPFAAGKQELVENSAALIRLANREAGMLPGFADLTRDMAARDAGAPRGLKHDELDALLTRMSKNAGVEESLNTLQAQAKAGHMDREEILKISRRLVQWRTELKQ